MRIGELIALRWSDIDLTCKSIQIADERSSGGEQARTTKGRRSRRVPLNPALEPVLRDLERHPDGFVFHGAKGALVRAKRVLDIFKREIRQPLSAEFPVPRGEIGFAKGTIHSFRHYFVSEAFRQGATEAEIMDWVGHQSSGMVHHYRHLRLDDSQRRMETINFLSDDTVSSDE
jgi:integrase